MIRRDFYDYYYTIYLLIEDFMRRHKTCLQNDIFECFMMTLNYRLAVKNPQSLKFR